MKVLSSILKRFVGLVVLLLTVVSCASRPVESNQIAGSFEANVDKLDLDNSFAFIHLSDQFYFSKILVSEGGRNCQFFIGFKNGQFKYRFPNYRIAELQKLNAEKISLPFKKSRALAMIDAFEVQQQKCTSEIAEKEATAGDVAKDVFATILYSPLIPIGIIGMVTFGAGDTVQSIKDSALEKRMNQLRLGKTKAEVAALLKRETTIHREGAYDYESIDYGYFRRLILVFEGDRLTGMIRGTR